ncbi:hypothetical protein CICLE_v10005005mg [Citrus x clementina]|uniref:Uncharacterized protein n=1 Tax=Citrus clementina TaxID=85681 RepID=V4U3N8_CITCL|nr:UPF0481 protein At3g47200 [Citrus x clementina]ESR33839.1 hypothetical protein CICLE_v10005005mg [Citrus x clementina]
MEQERVVDEVITTALRNLTNKLNKVSKKFSAGFKIRKVPEHLRTENVKAYEPQIIAIGPLTRHLLDNKTHLAEMEKHKVLYLNKRLHGDLSGLKTYLVAMRQSQENARRCYAEPLPKMHPFEFLEMLVLDACFIIELFRKFKLDEWDDDDAVFKTSWVRKKLGRDLLLADNQLPLFVLQEFYDNTEMPQQDRERNFQDLILGFFSKVLPVQLFEVSKIEPVSNLSNYQHLLGFIHNKVPGIICPDRRENWNFIVSATNLKEAGIKFEKIEGESLLSIYFDKDDGIMKIPALTIDDDTESFFRNISVYEQFFPIDAYAPFINYLKFMDCLINTAKDVELLCENKILHNCLGDDEVVANMFNRLGDSVALPLYNFYGDRFHNVNEYCDRHWKRWIANLRHNYFNTPWAIISVFAALFLLILTLTQTVFSVLAYFQ